MTNDNSSNGSPSPSSNHNESAASPVLPAQPPASPTQPAASETNKPSAVAPAAATAPTPAPTPAPAPAPTDTPLREDMLKSAVSFLSSPNVRSADTAKKVAFLRQKGLTQPEIEAAFKRVGESGAPSAAAAAAVAPPASAQATAVAPVVNRPPVPPRPAAYTQVVYYPMPPAPSMSLQRIVGVAVLFGFGAVGLSAAVLRVIKHFIGPIFTSIAAYQRNRYNERRLGFKALDDKLAKEIGKKPEQQGVKSDEQDEQDEADKPLERLSEKHQVMSDTLSRLVTMAQSRVQALKGNEPYSGLRDGFSDLRSSLSQSSDTYSSYSPYASYGFGRSGSQDSPAVQGFKSEIRSFKGMLLNRRNFPMVNTSRPSSPSTATTQ